MKTSPAYDAMSDHVIGPPTMTSQTMTSLTDHSVESILRDIRSDKDSSGGGDVAGHVDSTTGSASLMTSAEVEWSGGSCVATAAAARVELECAELWRQFYRLNTEMVITKSGRSVIRSLTQHSAR